MGTEMKTCTRCGATKNRSAEFHRFAHAKDGHSPCNRLLGWFDNRRERIETYLTRKAG